LLESLSAVFLPFHDRNADAFLGAKDWKVSKLMGEGRLKCAIFRSEVVERSRVVAGCEGQIELGRSVTLICFLVGLEIFENRMNLGLSPNN
jgi:hypothetical protein